MKCKEGGIGSAGLEGKHTGGALGALPRLQGLRQGTRPLFYRTRPVAPSRLCRTLAAYSQEFMGLQVIRRIQHRPNTNAQTRSHIRELTKVCERTIHETVLSCTRAYRRILNSTRTERPSLH